ncbi:hypothetical protein CCY97_07260 [Helicobacter sp. 10-6591]|nr:hypothetical protein CCY97_07260 [Helicobacter sp. 10-6591]
MGQRIEDIAKVLGINKGCINYDEKEQVYLISTLQELEIKKEVDFSQLRNFPLKFTKCHFSQDLLVNEQEFKEKLIFENVVFSKSINFSRNTFYREVGFFGCEFKNKLYLTQCVFHDNVMAFGVNLLSIDCRDSIFRNEVCFGREINDPNLEKGFHFGSCSFKDGNFLNCQFHDNVYFKNNEFHGAAFQNARFYSNAYFNNSTFKDSADFHECEFEKTACFYGVKFDKAPNFSQAQFKGSLNVVNTNLDFDFESLKEKIKQEHIEYNKHDKKPLDNFANDFRDSFRIFKNALIKDNNLLDASEFHRFELYCKEIELRESVRKRGTKAHDNEGIRKNMKPFKEFIDFLLLRFYRNLCDHHTDFLRCFNNLVLLVALYVGCLLLRSFNFLENKAPSSDILQKIDFVDIFAKFILECVAMNVKIVILLLLVLYLIVSVWKIFKDILPWILTSIKALLKNVGYFILMLIVPLVVIIMFYVLVATLFKLTPSILLPSFLNITGFFLFFFMYFSLVFLDSAIVRCLIVIIAYMTVSIAIGYKIAILNPLIGKLFTDTLEITDPFLNFITLAYIISMFLVLFSLQKTARKNSIVPN